MLSPAPVGLAEVVLLGRDQLRMDMLSWTKDDLHTPLTRLPDSAKETTKAALICFRQLQAFMGDRKTENLAVDGTATSNFPVVQHFHPKHGLRVGNRHAKRSLTL